jgi:formylglycine-generating enzyme required for sulfatase activity
VLGVPGKRLVLSLGATLALLALRPPLATAERKGCPAGMTRVEGFCIDAYEASLDVVGKGGKTLRRHSPYHTPKPGLRVAARSRRGVVPQAYLSQEQAAEACEAVGKRLCTDAEWLSACRGREPTRFPYGDEHVSGRCNDSGISPLRKLHGADDSLDVFGLEAMNDAKLNQLAGTVALTGKFRRCRNSFGAHDMVGNLHEWTADPEGTFRGGYYLDTKTHGEGCSYVTTGHNVKYRDYSIGFRCCKGGSGDRAVAKLREKRKAKRSDKKVHAVESGDTLSAIAKRFGSSVAAICDANRIRASDPIRPGQELVVPIER